MMHSKCYLQKSNYEIKLVYNKLIVANCENKTEKWQIKNEH